MVDVRKRNPKTGKNNPPLYCESNTDFMQVRILSLLNSHPLTTLFHETSFFDF